MLPLHSKTPGTGELSTDPLLVPLPPSFEHPSKDCTPDSDDSDSDSEDDREVKKIRQERLRDAGGWFGYLKDFSIFLPFVVPRDDLKVQLCLVVTLLVLLGGRLLRIAIPYTLGNIVDKVTSGVAPIRELLILMGLHILEGEAGLELIEDLAKIPIKRFSYERLTNAAFNHVMEQSFDFHSTQDSAEVMKTIEQGESLGNVLETIVIDMLPTMIDTLVACALFYKKFNLAVSGILFTASIVFVTAEASATRLTTDKRRSMTKMKRAETRSMHQAVQGWQTVAFFNQFQLERRKFAQAVKRYLDAKTHYERMNEIVEALVELLVPATFFSMALLILRQIAAGTSSPGSFVFFLQYWDSIIYPLKWLSNHYRWLVADFVDAERLLALLKTQPAIVDKPGASSPKISKGSVRFDSVCFSYDGTSGILNDISFSVEPGQTIALVGQTGAGKSSILKLLMRLYDINSGSITIDNMDVRDMTLSSLRDALSVVPQSPVFFNASIMENLRYARSSATNEEIYNACRSAAIHDRITSYSEGYNTEIGERGMKLSGGECQRLAIARALIKDAPVVLLDEATSAIDTVTEAQVKEAFSALKEGRATIMIAHRLSTTVSADQILVVDGGRIVQRGTHEELVKEEGVYKGLWDCA